MKTNLFIESYFAKKHKRGKRVVKLYEDAIRCIEALECDAAERNIWRALSLMSLGLAALFLVAYALK